MARDPEEAVGLLKKAVSCRNVDYRAHCLLGEAYAYVDGIHQDIDQAISHFKQARDFGSHTAERLLWNIYYGIFESCEDRKDITQAIRFYRMADSNGDMDACVKIGIMLRDGRGVEKDLEEAVALFRRAADNGHNTGNFLLGLCYQRGEGVGKNLDEAMRLFRAVSGE